MTSIESILTRELDLRFIDARNIATEARIALGIEGYPSKDHINLIRDEAVRIFQRKSLDERRNMQRMNSDFEAMKIPAGSRSPTMMEGSSSMDSTSDHISISSEDSSRRSGIRGLFRR